VIITPGWNAYLVQVVLMKDGEARMLVGKEVTSYADHSEGLRGDARGALGQSRDGLQVADAPRRAT
jgi:hypothetical protein